MSKKRRELHCINFLSDGIHKWRGATPILSKRPIIIQFSMIGWRIPLRNKTEPSDWIRKYLILTSLSVFTRIGVNLKVFNSKANHNPIQDLEERIKV